VSSFPSFLASSPTFSFINEEIVKSWHRLDLELCTKRELGNEGLGLGGLRNEKAQMNPNWSANRTAVSQKPIKKFTMLFSVGFCVRPESPRKLLQDVRA
jgi:hypothetical protein